MKRLKKNLSALVALVGVLATSQSLLAHGWSRDGAGLFGSSFQSARIARKLDLSDQQRQQFRKILDDARPEADELADAILTNRRALRELRRGTEMSENEIQEIADLRGQLISRMIVLKARVRGQINAVLTTDQRERFEKLQHRGKRHGKRRHRRS